MGLLRITVSMAVQTCMHSRHIHVYAFIERLPRLFLKEEEEKKSIQHLVILHPHWLITVMKIIVEITPTICYEGIASEHIQPLNRGVACMEIFKHFLKDFISGSSDITLDHLLLILRSYCLIFPLQPEPKALSCPEGADGDDAHGASYSEYIVPCKLPKDPDDKDVDILEKECCIFYFDFCQFLPDEIYHRLMCLASAASEPQPRQPNIFSKRRCVFHSLFGTYWIMEAEREMHRLKFTVLRTW